MLLFFGWSPGLSLSSPLTVCAHRTCGDWSRLSCFRSRWWFVGYTLISHAFDIFLYPDPGFRPNSMRRQMSISSGSMSSWC